MPAGQPLCTACVRSDHQWKREPGLARRHAFVLHCACIMCFLTVPPSKMVLTGKRTLLTVDEPATYYKEMVLKQKGGTMVGASVCITMVNRTMEHIDWKALLLRPKPFLHYVDDCFCAFRRW